MPMILIKEGGVLPTHTNWVKIPNRFKRHTARAGLVVVGGVEKWIGFSQMVAKVGPKGVNIYIPEWLYIKNFGWNED